MGVVMMIELALVGGVVTQVSFGYQVVIQLWPLSEIRIEGPFTWTSSTGEATKVDTPIEASAVAGDLASLIDEGVVSAVIDDDEELKVFFAKGSSLTVPASEVAEAYDASLQGSPSRIVSPIGGPLQIWD